MPTLLSSQDIEDIANTVAVYIGSVDEVVKLIETKCTMCIPEQDGITIENPIPITKDLVIGWILCEMYYEPVITDVSEFPTSSKTPTSFVELALKRQRDKYSPRNKER